MKNRQDNLTVIRLSPQNTVTRVPGKHVELGIMSLIFFIRGINHGQL
jgi:hypothetical protein